MAATERTRLHITPFNSDLLDRYIPQSLKAAATNISLHSVETFPERGFGYVELPTTEAQRLKMKLNGSTLKGAKVKIEEAKPEKKRKSSNAVEEDVDDKKARKKSKKDKRKKEHGVIPGHELAEGRRVKRGWEEKTPARKSKKKDNGGLEGKKLRFKTVLPPNKSETGEKVESKAKKDKKEKGEKEGKKGRKEVVVKEFANTTKPISQAAVAPKKIVSYEEGVGWVDEDGNVVEEEPPQKKRKRSKVAQEAPEAEVTKHAANLEPSVEDDISSDSEEPDADADESQAEQVEQEQDASGSDLSEDDVNKEDADDHVDRQLKQAQTNLASNAAVEREQSNSIPTADRLSAEVDAASADNKEVHPLEALFKRPAPNAEEAVKAKKPTPIDTSFNFFNSGADDAEDGVTENNPPQTPHTKRDLEWRSVRSAAPTPDTAAIGKRFSFPFAAEDVDGQEEGEDADMQNADDDDDDDDDDGLGPGAAGSKQGEREESEFRKWFYENRGDLNRSWKKRRREEKKIVRQRENRRLSRRLA